MHLLRQKTTHTFACLMTLSLLPFVIPSLQRWRITLPQAASTQAPAQATVSTSPMITESGPGEIEDASGKALQPFFAALRKTETSNHITRISHYGDSPITGDLITSTVRRTLQLRFGDAGHGFILAAKPWAWYGHIGVNHSVSSGWQSEPMFIGKGDHRYGFGGATFTTRAAGVTASFSTVDKGEVGKSVSAFDIYFLAQPGGGEFDVEVDGQRQARVTTASNETRSGFHRVNMAAGEHLLTLRTVGNGEVRLFGVVLESGARGVQYDSLGVNGAFVGLLNRYQDEATWAEQLQRRKPDLVILAYGANESEYENWPMEQYEKDTREVVRRIRAALPNASILFVGPMDRGKRGAGAAIVTRPTIPKLIEAQRRLAAELGCAFFDTFTAMGGEGTVARWYEAKPKLMTSDLTHPTWQGSEIVGSLIHDALLRAYEKRRGATTLAQK
ncbi:MAG: hypothetical protein JNM09_22290 [Blastocatellia bacterium]|nr:hypothetical protein [Blastocatellia bacterium]